MTYISSLLDLKVEEANQYFSEKTFAELNIIKKELEVGFQELEKRKDLILGGILSSKIARQEGDAVLNDIYCYMQKIEEFAIIVEAYKRERSPDQN